MILKGNLLVADPKMFQDYNFRRSVIVLVDHNNDGTVGFVLNKQHEFSSQDILPEINCNSPIFKKIWGFPYKMFYKININ